MKRHKGFTIVELITVIVVISILATIAVVASNYVQRQARDNERKSDVLVIKAALEKYYDANGTYPIYAACQSSGGGCDTSTLIPALVPGYIAQVPSAPTGANYKYVHHSSVTISANYGIYVTRETDTPCRTGNLYSTWWSSTPMCGY